MTVTLTRTGNPVLVRYAYPLSLAAAVMFAGLATTCGILQTINPQPDGWQLTATYSGGSIFWLAAALWARHERQHQ